MTMPIDVIVPVYRDFDATRRCLESVLASTSKTPHELIVANDASPEPAIVDFVRDLAARGKATLIEQPVAQGCAAALNRRTSQRTQ